MSKPGSDPPRFDPRTQACLPALTKSGDRRMVSLLEALERPDDLAAITGSTPGEAVAVIEYLLAILYAADEAPASVSAWQKAVETRAPFERATAWLRSRPDDEWNLFHPERPLGQNSLLAPHLDRHGVGFAQLVPERTGDYNQLFDHVHLHYAQPLSADAAFRSMLTQHAYGLPGRAMVSADLLGPQLTYLATGRLAGRIRVLARGETLGDLLRLNIAPTRDTGTFNATWTDGRARRDFRATKASHTPDGPADLHSFLGRSIMLHPVALPDGTHVDRVILGAGELLDPDLPDALRQDEVLVERNGRLVALAATPDTQMWRQANALYAAATDRDKGGDLYHRIATLTARPGRWVDLWAVGVVFNKTIALTWVDDHFPFTPGKHVDLRRAADDGAAICDYAATCLYAAANTIREIVYPQEKPSDKATHTAQFNGAREFWAGAGAPFHRLLDRVNQDAAPEKAIEDFGETAYLLAQSALDTRLQGLPGNARGHRARAEAHARLRGMAHTAKAPRHFKPPKEQR